MLLSKTVPALGRVFYPLGAGGQLNDLVDEIDEYFRHGIGLKPGDVVFDVGANIGAFALHAAQKSGGGLNLYCFEPIPQVYEALEKNLRTSPLLSDSQVQLFPVGLTALGEPAHAEFHYFKRLPCDTTQHLDEKRGEFAAFFSAKGESAGRSVERTVPGSVGRVAGSAIARAVASIPRGAMSQYVFERAIGRTKLRCPLETVEAVATREGVKRIDLLKVDVEGAELQVLQGLGPATWAKVRQVVLEGHDMDGRLDAIKLLLRQNGFDRVTSEVPPLAIDRKLNKFVLHALRS